MDITGAEVMQIRKTVDSLRLEFQDLEATMFFRFIPNPSNLTVSLQLF